jgi:hypothetical protein
LYPFPDAHQALSSDLESKFTSNVYGVSNAVDTGHMSSKVKRFLLAVAIAAPVCVALLFVWARHFVAKLEPEIRSQAVRYLEQHFDSDVALDTIRIRLPNMSAIGLFARGGRGTLAKVEGENLSLRCRGRSDVPPLFTIRSFQFDLDLGALRQDQPHVSRVVLDGMTITLPPKEDRPNLQVRGQDNGGKNFVIDHVDISNARLVILPKVAGRKPLDFALESIRLHSAGAGQQMKYDAILTNPRPPGQIISHGFFGPWNRDSPGDTPLAGDYDFANADLGIFSGIAGILHSNGHFTGTLSAVRAHGQATVPDFRLKSSGNPVPLWTDYDVLVDGTNGNTVLEPVRARLKDTAFQTSGGIIKRETGGQRAIDLDVVMPEGHLEDLLLLAAKGKPLMSGLIRMHAKISIPPLGGSVQEKLKLAGSFDIARGEFLREEVQEKVDELSRRAQGRPGDQDVDDVFYRMKGVFELENQVITLSSLNFGVPGAEVALHGQYRVAEDVLDFHGSLKLRAKVSQTMTGWKHWLAKPLDPFLEKDGAGTFLKIQVAGSAQKPQFGRDHGE